MGMCVLLRAHSGEVKVRAKSLAGGRLKYELFYEECEENKSFKSYGVRISCSLFEEYDEEVVRDLTVNEQYATEFFERLVKGFVTPVTLCCIAEDYLAEKYGKIY